MKTILFRAELDILKPVMTETASRFKQRVA